MSRALPRVFLRRSRLDGGWCIPRTLQHMSIIPRKSRRDSSSHRDRRFPSASATFVRPAWSFVCLLLFVSFAHDVAPTSISSVRVVLLFHPCASPFSSRATTRLAVVAMSFVSCAMHQRVLSVRPNLDSFGVHPNESRFDATNTPFRTRTDPGSNSGSKEVEANPIDVARCGDDGEWTWTRHVRGTSGAKRGRRVAVGGARAAVHASAAEAWCERNGIDTKAVSRRTTGVCLRSTALAEEEEAVARRADGWQPRMVPACRRSRDVLPPSWTDACRSTTVRRPGEPRTIQA